MPLSSFPAPRVAFMPIATPTKTRIFLVLGDQPSAVQALSQVTTLNGSPDAATALVDALNSAAWTGDRTDLDKQLSGLPEAVGQACRVALDGCPDPSSVLVGANGLPMTVLRHYYFTEPLHDLVVHAGSAMDLGLQVLIVNGIEDRGAVEFDVALLSDDVELMPDELDGWWPVPSGKTIAARIHPSPKDLADVFRDPRWETNEARAYWVWIKDSNDEDYGATAEWVVEFFDQPLEADSNFRVFVPDDLDEDERGFLAPRNRFILWLALWNMSTDLDELVVSWDDHDSIVRRDMPELVRSQSREWWREMFRSVGRLGEAARRGALDELVPRTPAEEALISLATRSDYTDWAEDLMNDMELRHVYEALPVCEEDGEWHEVLGDLTGDVDVQILWTPRLAHHADPEDPTNKDLGIGDYRPKSWHRLFDRALGGAQDDLEDWISRTGSGDSEGPETR